MKCSSRYEANAKTTKTLIVRGQFNRRVNISVAMLLFFSSQVLAQKYPPPFPRDGVKKVQESDCFVIWDVTWENGKSTGIHENLLDQVAVWLAEGAIKVTRPDGTWSIEQERIGSVRFEGKGTVDAEEGVSDKPSHAIVFQLKEVVQTKWPITEGIPGQYPRAGAVKLFETDRITVWDETRRPGVRSPLHLHYNKVAGVWLEGGRIRSISEGATEMLSKKPGEVLIGRPRKAPHTEETVEGVPRIIAIEFK
jgi:hypothetical protein